MYLSYGVIIRDKVRHFGQFDDKTPFGNESNLHTEMAFTHNISSFSLCSPMDYTFSFQCVSWAKS